MKIDENSIDKTEHINLENEEKQNEQDGEESSKLSSPPKNVSPEVENERRAHEGGKDVLAELPAIAQEESENEENGGEESSDDESLRKFLVSDHRKPGMVTFKFVFLFFKTTL